jgi:hypothetical protein
MARRWFYGWLLLLVFRIGRSRIGNDELATSVRNRIQGVELSSLAYEQSLWNVAQLKVAD